MARDPGRLGCAAESSRRDEPLVATASRVQRWLLLEQPGSWGSNALRESAVPDDVARQLDRAARDARVRVVLVRRPDRSQGEPRRARLVHSGRHHRWIEEVTFDDPAELLALDLGSVAEPEPPGLGTPGPRAVHLVCTNGRHDPCCADFGRPVVRALRRSGIPEVWESSHIGGDRFAANLVILPDGIYYGRVPTEGAARLIEEHAAGRLDLDHFRGRSSFPLDVQAAELLLRRQLDERRVHALTLVGSERVGDDQAVVRFAIDTEVYAVRFRRREGVPALFTCSSSTEDRPWVYDLLEMTAEPA